MSFGSFLGGIARTVGSAAMGAIAPIAGPLVSGGMELLGGMSQNSSSAREARRQRDWSERMSSTAWQRGVADMRAAGINPMLAVSEGPASSPGGAAADVPRNPLGEAASAFMARKIQNVELKRLDAERDLTDQRARTEAAQRTFLYSPNTGMALRRAMAEIDELEARAGSHRAGAEYARSGIPIRQGQGAGWKWFGEGVNTARRGWQMINETTGGNPFWLQQRGLNFLRDEWRNRR